MRGRHVRPTRAGTIARQAARIGPAAAVAGAILGVAVHHEAPPRIIPLEGAPFGSTGSAGSAELASSVKAAAPAAQVYVVQPGDDLWSIAQHFYGTGFKWTAIYYANQAHIHDPNEIFAGQRLVIPRAGQAAPNTDAVSASPVHQVSGTSSLPGVPAGATYYIQQAAKATGLPVRVVAAQNEVESSYGQNMGPSSAGAMGPWQFEPYTWPAYSSAPFSEADNWAVSTQAYVAMMNQLLHWSGGNVRMALAAYNAGQGNWQAGLGYADEILAMAG
jgi:hypothetical protein